MTGPLLEAALDYAANGLAVLPLHWPVGAGKCSCSRAGCKHVGKHPATEHGVKDATTNAKQIREWWNRMPTANIGIATGAKSERFILDVDPQHDGDRSLAQLEAQHGQLPKTTEATTGSRGRHLHFEHPGWRVPNRVGIAPGLDIRGDDGYIVAPPSQHASGGHYSWALHPDVTELAPAPEWLLDLVRSKGHSLNGKPPLGSGILEGERNARMTSMGGSARRAGFGEASIAAALLVENQGRCRPPLDEAEIRKIAASVARYPARPPVLDESPWPAPLAKAALHGITGDFLRLVEPHSEADPAALLMQFLVMAGSAIGHGPFFRAEADKHTTNLFATIVGPTSKGRKGTSLGHARTVLELADPAWAKDCRQTGLSSGEGLIWAVRDAIVRTEPVKSKKGRVEDYQQVIADPGVKDKRMFVLEPEFGSVLSVMDREGNTLSPLVRSAWDHGDLRILTKNSPARATGAHISIVGHITQSELRRDLDRTEAANGFGNRFLWICARRSKALPEGGAVPQAELAALAERLRGALQFARRVGEMRRDDVARQLWREVYAALSEGRPGLLGDVTSRAEAQVVRLSITYALLDQSDTVRIEHLQAALEVWRYAFDSASYIFGDSLGDPLADKILAALRAAPDGLDREEVRAVVGNRLRAERIDRALEVLAQHGLAHTAEVETGGRRAERWWSGGGNGGMAGPGEGAKATWANSSVSSTSPGARPSLASGPGASADETVDPYVAAEREAIQYETGDREMRQGGGHD